MSFDNTHKKNNTLPLQPPPPLNANQSDYFVMIPTFRFFPPLPEIHPMHKTPTSSLRTASPAIMGKDLSPDQRLNLRNSERC